MASMKTGAGSWAERARHQAGLLAGRAARRGRSRPDHAPTIEGETNDRPGYAMGGKVFAFGHRNGIMEALKLPYV
jgi:D-mannonate dehydratase